MGALWSGDKPSDGGFAGPFLSNMTPLTDKRVRELGGGKRGLKDVTNSPLQPRSYGTAALQRGQQQAERDPCVRCLDLGGSPAGQVFQDENEPSQSQRPGSSGAAAAHSRDTNAAGPPDAALGRRPGSRLSLKRGRSLISGPPARVQHERAPLSPLVRFSVPEERPEEQPAKRQNVDGVPTPTAATQPAALHDSEAQVPELPLQPQRNSPSLVCSPAEQIDGPDAAEQPQSSAVVATSAPAPPATPATGAAEAAASLPADAEPRADASKVTVRRRRRLAARPPPSPALRRATLERHVSFAPSICATPSAMPTRSQLSVTAYHSQ